MNIFPAIITAEFGGCIGLFFSFKLKEREKIMSLALLFTKELAVQIRYTNAEIGEILVRSAQNEEYKALNFVAECTTISAPYSIGLTR